MCATDYKEPIIVAYAVQNHPQDSRVTIERERNTVQTLNAKMGTGGGNTPFVLIVRSSSQPDSPNTSRGSRS